MRLWWTKYSNYILEMIFNVSVRSIRSQLNVTIQAKGIIIMFVGKSELWFGRPRKTSSRNEIRVQSLWSMQLDRCCTRAGIFCLSSIPWVFPHLHPHAHFCPRCVSLGLLVKSPQDVPFPRLLPPQAPSFAAWSVIFSLSRCPLLLNRVALAPSGMGQQWWCVGGSTVFGKEPAVCGRGDPFLGRGPGPNILHCVLYLWGPAVSQEWVSVTRTTLRLQNATQIGRVRPRI